jgi:hypothetical protein
VDAAEWLVLLVLSVELVLSVDEASGALLDVASR